MADVVIAVAHDVASARGLLTKEPARHRVAVLPRAAAGPAARATLREAGLECVTTLESEDDRGAARLAAELVRGQGWRPVGSAATRVGESAFDGDTIGWYELRIPGDGRLVTTDRPITRLHGTGRYIASFNLLGQGFLNRVCADLLHQRLAVGGLRPGEAFDIIVCSESKAVGLAQALAERFDVDRYVVLRKGVKNYMPRRPRPPVSEEAQSITTAGAQSLVLDPNDLELVEGRRVLLVDDVIATGGTVHAACALLARVDARIAGVATILLKGPEPSVPRLIALARPLL